MTDDIVAELAWLATTAIWSGKDTHLRETLQRARDEIVGLREDRDTLFAAMEERGPVIRAEVLEEAARACEAYALQAEEDGKTDKADYSANIDTARRLMFLIRALKDKP
jgi:hypothetical protein